MKDNKCIEDVWDRFRSYRCSRKAGHGPNGQYCAQHAIKHLDEMDLPTLLFIYTIDEDFRGNVSIAEGRVIKETAKTYIIKKEDEEGFGYRDRIPKDEVFTNKTACLKALIDGQSKKIEKLTRGIDKAKKNISWAIEEMAK